MSAPRVARIKEHVVLIPGRPIAECTGGGTIIVALTVAGRRVICPGCNRAVKTQLVSVPSTGGAA